MFPIIVHTSILVPGLPRVTRSRALAKSYQDAHTLPTVCSQVHSLQAQSSDTLMSLKEQIFSATRVPPPEQVRPGLTPARALVRAACACWGGAGTSAADYKKEKKKDASSQKPHR